MANQITSLQLNSISLTTLLDNRVLGLKAGVILTNIYGGKTEGGGNSPIIYYKPDGTKCSVGTGDLNRAFIKSSCKGIGRMGNDLKVPDALCFIHLTLSPRGITKREFSKQEVLNF